jgi:hypothetical protein
MATLYVQYKRKIVGLTEQQAVELTKMAEDIFFEFYEGPVASIWQGNIFAITVPCEEGDYASFVEAGEIIGMIKERIESGTAAKDYGNGDESGYAGGPGGGNWMSIVNEDGEIVGGVELDGID